MTPMRDLHIIKRAADWPEALCGFRTEKPWDAKVETRGRDRCATCLQIARNIRRFRDYVRQLVKEDAQ